MWRDLDRPPLREAALRRALTGPGSPWRDVRVLARTASTNADVRVAAEAGAGEGLVLVADEQTRGRGRLDRTWSSPPRSGLTFSVLLRPGDVPVAQWSWLPLLAGVAVARAVRRIGEVDATLKWPNDVLVDRRKLAGILVERAGDAAVVGVGLNVSTRAEELPVPTATSLAVAGAATTDRDPILRAMLRELGEWYAAWRGYQGDVARSGVRAAYLQLCRTVGSAVRVEQPGREPLAGRAVDVDEDGRLVVDDGAQWHRVAAGDVVHALGGPVDAG